MIDLLGEISVSRQVHCVNCVQNIPNNSFGWVWVWTEFQILFMIRNHFTRVNNFGQVDPFRCAHIQREVNGNTFMGVVVDIEQGTITKERISTSYVLEDEVALDCFELWRVCCLLNRAEDFTESSTTMANWNLASSKSATCCHRPLTAVLRNILPQNRSKRWWSWVMIRKPGYDQETECFIRFAFPCSMGVFKMLFFVGGCASRGGDRRSDHGLLASC